MAKAEAKPGTYHHGDLRAALLRAAVGEITRDGVNNLSMRAVARRAGVSHAAPAHHFGDKTGLLTALAAEGFGILHQMTTPTLGRDDALVRAGEAYVEFALAHPAHFAVMFDPHLLRMDDPALDAERSVAFANLFTAVQETTGTDDPAQVTREAIAAWAVVHGTAVLWLQGNLPLTEANSVSEVFAQMGSGLKTVAIASAEHLPQPS
ncbi:MAG TPA: TetR/AcrR family transcriptional regulator [Acidimicrobiales bacterium]|jgi:AcrR family transcriptional regulator